MTTRQRVAESYHGLNPYGFIVPGLTYLRAASTLMNEIKALAVIQLAPTPRVDVGLHGQLFKWLRGNYKQLLPTFLPTDFAFGPDANEQFERWNQHFPKATQNANMRAWPQVKRDNLSPRF